MDTQKESKIKTYVLIVSRYFPSTHKSAGKPTNFPELIMAGEKIHTIRSNYELWLKRAEDINSGKAILSLRYWSEMPYKSKQVEFMQLNKIGIEKIKLSNFSDFEILSKNDGLKIDEFEDWFKGKEGEMAIIHFTNFTYGQRI